MCEKYNGWTNYETWNVKLWLDNEQSTQEYARELARGARECNDNPAYGLAETLRDWIEDDAPELEPSMYSDMLNASLRSVNWYEIAESYLSDLDDES